MTQAMELVDEERVLPGHPLHDFSSDEHRSAVASRLGELGLAPAEERAAPAAS